MWQNTKVERARYILYQSFRDLAQDQLVQCLEPVVEQYFIRNAWSGKTSLEMGNSPKCLTRTYIIWPNFLTLSSISKGFITYQKAPLVWEQVINTNNSCLSLQSNYKHMKLLCKKIPLLLVNNNIKYLHINPKRISISCTWEITSSQWKIKFLNNYTDTTYWWVGKFFITKMSI